AAIIGYQVAYQIGLRGGPRLFKRQDGVLFRADYIPRTEAFITKHGGKTIVLARFVAVVRTLAPLVAGVGKMPKGTFLFYNIFGALIWTSSITLGAYWVGGKVDNLDRFILPLVLGGIALTFIIEFWLVLRNKSSRQRLVSGLKEEYRYFFKKN